MQNPSRSPLMLSGFYPAPPRGTGTPALDNRERIGIPIPNDQERNPPLPASAASTLRGALRPQDRPTATGGEGSGLIVVAGGAEQGPSTAQKGSGFDHSHAHPECAGGIH